MPSDLTSEWTAEGMREMFDHVEQAFRPDHDLAVKMQELYWGQHKVSIMDTADKGRKRVVQPERMVTEEAGRIINLISSFYINPVTAAVEWQGEGSRAASVAEKIEVGVNEAYDQLNPPVGGPRRDIRFDQALIGHGAQLGPMPGGAYWWDFPAMHEGETERQWDERYEEWRRGGPLPFAYVALPAESTYPASLGLMNDLCLSSMQVTYWDLREMFSVEELGEAMGDAQFKPGEPFTLAMASNQEYLAYSLMDVPFSRSIGPVSLPSGKSDHLLRSVHHGMGRSVIRIPAGITRSKHRTSGGYGHYWLPALFHVASQIVQADRALSMVATASKFDAFPPMKRFGASDLLSEGADANINREQEGDIIDFPMSDEGRKLGDIEAMIQPRFGEKTQALVAFLLGRTERIAGASQVMEGLSSEDTAWATHEMIQVATNKHAPLTEGMKAADMDDFEMIMRSAEVHGHKIDLRKGEGGDIALVPEQMENWRPVMKGEYRLHMPVNQIALWQAGVNFMERAAAANVPLPVDWVMEEVMDIEQPWEMFKRWVQWKAAMDPRTYDRLYARRMDEADATLSAEEGISVEQMDQEYQRMNPDQQQRAAGAYQALRGASRAGTPLQTAPGGPQPPMMPEVTNV